MLSFLRTHLFQLEWVKVAQLCLTLCDPMDYTVHAILQASILEWVAFSFSRGSSQPRDRTKSPALQADSLPAEPQVKPKNTGVGSLSLLQWLFSTKESNWGLLHCRQILNKLSSQGSLRGIAWWIKKFLFSLELTWSAHLLIGYPLQSSLHHVQDSWKWLVCQACLFLCEMRTGREARKSIIFSNVITGELIESFRVTKNNFCPFPPQLSSSVIVAKI